MAHEEEQRKSRVVVETPTARREYEQTQRAYIPERSGYSTGMVALVVIAAVALTAIVMLFVMNPSQPENTNVRINTTTQPTPLAPAGYTTPPPLPTATTVVVPPTASVPPVATVPGITETAPAASPAGPDPARLQADLNRALLEDRDLSAAGASITGTITNGRAVLSGTVNSERLKNRARQVALTVPGIRQVDISQITVIGGDTAPPPPATSPQ